VKNESEALLVDDCMNCCWQVMSNVQFLFSLSTCWQVRPVYSPQLFVCV